MLMNSWDQIRNHLQQRVSSEGYDNWLKSTTFLGLDGNTLSVSVPDADTRSWLESEYAQPIRESIRDLALPIRQIVYETELGRRGQITAGTADVPLPEMEITSTVLNPKFTFDTF